MSTHREIVTKIVEAVASSFEKDLSESIVQELVAAGREQHELRLFEQSSATPASLSVILRRAEAALLASPVEDFREASVSVLLSPRERVGRCVAGDAMTSRRLRLVDVLVKAGLRTRWVHIFAERQSSRQWVIA